MTNWTELFHQHLRTVQKHYADAMQADHYEQILIYAGRAKRQFLDDMEYPFKVNPHFKGWVPLLEHPDSFILYTPGQKPTLVYYQPDDFWHRTPQAPSGYWVDSFDVRVVKTVDEVKSHVPTASKKWAIIGEWPEAWRDGVSADINPEALLTHVHYFRAYKTPYERACMQEANRCAVKGHIAARDAFFNGAPAFEIHLAYLRATQHMEYQLPYKNIVALNQNAAILHYYHVPDANESIEPPRSFLLDAGANYQGYAADITRTYAYHDGEFAELIAAIDSAQQAMVAAVKPGLSYADLHLYAHEKIAEVLHALELVRLPVADIFEQAITSVFFPHGVGHLIGLQVHDVGAFIKNPQGDRCEPPANHPYLRSARIIEPGQVFTVEPGVYFIDLLLQELRNGPHQSVINWDKIERLKPYGGVRIEDNVMVHADRVENMTREAFAAA